MHSPEPGGTAGGSPLTRAAASRVRRRAGEADPGLPAALTTPGRGRHAILRGALIAALVLTGGGGFLVAYAAFTLPSIDTLGRATGSVRVLDSHGALIAEVQMGSTPHDSVPLAQVAPVMQQAIIAAEDRQFPTEGAINPTRILKALVVDVLLGRPAQGASTITQQLARNVFLSPTQSAMRKLREALLADEIDQRYSKAQILEMYLNTIYFGHGAYGIEDAAQTYFGVHASQLTLAEAALIAGLPQAPSLDDPYVNPQAAFARMHYVLDGMTTMGAITSAQAVAVDPLVGVDVASASQAAPVIARRAHNQQTILSSLHENRGEPAACRATPPGSPSRGGACCAVTQISASHCAPASATRLTIWPDRCPTACARAHCFAW